MLLLDTSAVSAFMHRREGALRRLQEEEPSNVFLCTPVATEIHFGLSRLEVGSRRRRLLEEEFRRLRTAVRWVEWQETASIEFGRWKARLQERGTPIKDMDLAIASVALGLPARLATLNIRHFARIDDLELVDWSTTHPDPEERA